jgi:putative heme-binding domain-containing protein
VGIADGLLIRELMNSSRGPDIKALSLSLLSPDYTELNLAQLDEYARAEYEPLQLAAARTIAERTDEERFEVLEKLSRDESLNETVRVEALAGLAAKSAEYRELLEEFATKSGLLGDEAKRVLRLSGLKEMPLEEKPDVGDLEAWVRLLTDSGDLDAGRRLFFSAVGPKCSVCHQHGGRGGNIGPDLTHIGESNSRERIITSILDPSRDVAPHYETWILVTDDGKTHVGLRLPKSGDDGTEPYSDTNGQRFELPSESILHREASKTSIMPAGLEKSISIQDMRDLVTFLME